MKSEGKESIEYYLNVSSYGYPETEKRARNCMSAHKMEKLKKKLEPLRLDLGVREEDCDREPRLRTVKNNKNFQEKTV